MPVLVVEDDVAIREALTEALYAENFEVHGALDGDDALAVLGAERRRWVVLLDLTMPRVDGWTFLESLRALNVPEDTFRVLIVSAQPRAVELRSRPFVVGVVQKPVDFPALLSTVRELAER